MSEDRLINEFSKILEDVEYNNCKVIYLTRDESISTVSRDKDDVFSTYENYHVENSIFKSIFSIFKNEVSDSSRNNEFIEFVNNFDTDSQKEFKQLIENITNNI